MKIFTMLLAALAASPLLAQTNTDAPPAPYASEGGKVQVIPPRPVDAVADPANLRAQVETVDGLSLVIAIDGGNITLVSATLARVPRSLTRADRKLAGDFVSAVGFAGAERVARGVVADPVVNASEDRGLVRLDKRQVVIMLAADRPLDRVEVEALATRARGVLDVRGAYAQICTADPKSAWCPGGSGK